MVDKTLTYLHFTIRIMLARSQEGFFFFFLLAEIQVMELDQVLDKSASKEQYLNSS